MNPVNKALWFIESHFGRDISLDDIASVGGVSRYHMSRAFTLAMGHPALQYMRARRLTEAAKALAAGAPDILTVALDAGYNSHEAFTRAFRDEFGVTPESIRAQRHLHNIQLVEPIKMNETMLESLDPPRFENAAQMLVAGLGARFSAESSSGIPALWQRFEPHIERIPGRIGRVTHGVCYNTDDAGNIDYLCAVQVEDFSKLSSEWTRLRIPARRYAVFKHPGHVAAIRRTWNTIFNKWLPESGHRVADAPELERYGEDFNPRTGFGDIEIWIPIET